MSDLNLSPHSTTWQVHQESSGKILSIGHDFSAPNYRSLCATEAATKFFMQIFLIYHKFLKEFTSSRAVKRILWYPQNPAHLTNFLIVQWDPSPWAAQ